MHPLQEGQGVPQIPNGDHARRLGTIQACTDCRVTCLLVPQTKVTIFAKSHMDHVQELLRIVGSSEEGEPLEKQLLCSQTSHLMARVLAAMMRTAVQVRLHPACVVAMCTQVSRYVPRTPEVLRSRMLHVD
jgi:hypothetical protein